MNMRHIIHIPIIHNAADLGSLSTFVQSHYAKICGQASWSQREQLIKTLWHGIEVQLDAIGLDAAQTRIYQDGLPICGFEERIVRELANGGSRNHQLILKWMGRGAILMGTEDSKLLIEEYELQKQLLTRTPNIVQPSEAVQSELSRLLQARDTFIANRIAETLKPDETGLLFLGALHHLDMSKVADIRIASLGDKLHKAVGRPRT